MIQSTNKTTNFLASPMVALSLKWKINLHLNYLRCFIPEHNFYPGNCIMILDCSRQLKICCRPNPVMDFSSFVLPFTHTFLPISPIVEYVEFLSILFVRGSFYLPWKIENGYWKLCTRKQKTIKEFLHINEKILRKEEERKSQKFESKIN